LAAPEPAVGAQASEASDVAALLEVKGLSKAFGGFQALSEISLEVSAGEAVGLVGPNGSGKTTLINVVSGVYKPSGGTVLLRGEDVTGLGSHKLCRLGLNRTFQNPRPLAGLTVAENVALVRPSRHSERAVLEGGPLGFVGLDRVASRRVSALTSGEQKLLDLARALAARPEVLLVDELGAGLNPGELDHVAGLLRRLKDAGMALVVVEHLMGFLEQVVDTVTVLNAGMAIFRGDLRAAVADRRVVEVFLGEHQG
jgi:branched-chain amino acid transport system ATP-binding protein